MSAERAVDRNHQIAAQAHSLTPEGLARLQHDMGQGALLLAARFDPAAHSDFWDRTRGWTSLNLTTAPPFPFGPLSFADAAQLNAMLPTDDLDFAPAQPFFLHASGPEHDRAVLCMTQAIYYEAALEPTEGQQAVAQTVLNRVRHPDFPKSVCGVVYQGAQLSTGCQFSFTCDGSLARTPIEPYWTRAKTVAMASLDGYVAPQIGSATHYHADYVFPRWGPQMVKIIQLGAHIFYRYPGPAGAPQVLTGHYAGNELAISLDRPLQAAQAAAKAAALAGQATPDPLQRPMLLIPGVGTPDAQGANVPVSDVRAIVVPGQVIAGRRMPTKEEIARINAALPPLPAADVPPATATAAIVAGQAAARPPVAKPVAASPPPAAPVAAAGAAGQ
jgi:spore germination cell wall hydrolase CwlJ-like protein